MTSTRAARAQARTASSSGSANTMGSIGAGRMTWAREAYPRISSWTEVLASCSRRRNFRRARTSSSSARRAGLVKRSTAPDRARSRTARDGPFHNNPEITTLVSATARMRPLASGSGGLDLGVELRLGQRGNGESGQAVRGSEEAVHAAAAELFSQHGLQGVRLEEATTGRLPGDVVG